MIIRNESEPDLERITEVTRAAFEDHPFSRQTEVFIIHALRAAGALAVSLVAEVDGQVVGHIAFSPVTVSDGSKGWYGMGPVSVLPGFQKRGIGKALVLEGLSRLKSEGASGCALVGNPEFYGRFGFRNHPELIYEGVPQEYFLALPFGPEKAQGLVVFHEGFSAKG
jgi:putative acetyltransferase